MCKQKSFLWCKSPFLRTSLSSLLSISASVTSEMAIWYLSLFIGHSYCFLACWIDFVTVFFFNPFLKILHFPISLNANGFNSPIFISLYILIRKRASMSLLLTLLTLSSKRVGKFVIFIHRSSPVSRSAPRTLLIPR